jgi:hypothetical protein
MNYAQQNATTAFLIFSDDQDAYGVGLAGLTITVELSKAGAAFASVTPTIADRGLGWYAITPTSAHRDTLGENTWRFSATGAVIAGRRELVGVASPDTAAWGALTTLGATAPANWINAAAIAASALVGKGDWLTTLGSNAPSNWINAAAIAAAALDGKGDWLTTLGATAPSNWINAAAIAAAALNGKGDWLTTLGATAPSNWINAAAIAAAALNAKGDWLTAAQTRDAVGLNDPNLDAQLAAILAASGGGGGGGGGGGDVNVVEIAGEPALTVLRGLAVLRVLSQYPPAHWTGADLLLIQGDTWSEARETERTVWSVRDADGALYDRLDAADSLQWSCVERGVDPSACRVVQSDGRTSVLASVTALVSAAATVGSGTWHLRETVDGDDVTLAQGRLTVSPSAFGDP